MGCVWGSVGLQFYCVALNLPNCRTTMGQLRTPPMKGWIAVAAATFFAICRNQNIQYYGRCRLYSSSSIHNTTRQQSLHCTGTIPCMNWYNKKKMSLRLRIIGFICSVDLFVSTVPCKHPPVSSNYIHLITVVANAKQLTSLQIHMTRTLQFARRQPTSWSSQTHRAIYHVVLSCLTFH